LKKIERVMLIDDSEADNVYHQIMIERSGVVEEVVVAESGFEALSYLKDGASPDVNLIFLDINMPGMNGFEFLEQYARLNDRHPAAVVVMLTSSPSSEDHRRATEYPAIKAYMTKPLSAEATAKLVEQFF
jgi:CheY-like chemotaxis protein